MKREIKKNRSVLPHVEFSIKSYTYATETRLIIKMRGLSDELIRTIRHLRIHCVGHF